MGRAMVARLGLGLLLLALLLPTQVRPWRPRGSGAAPCWGGSEPPPGDRPAPPARAADWGCGEGNPAVSGLGEGNVEPTFRSPGGLPPPSRGPGNNAPPRVGREAPALPRVPSSSFPGRLESTTRFLPEVRGPSGKENVSFPPLERPETSGCPGRAPRFPPGVSSRPLSTTQRGRSPSGRRSPPSSS